MKACNFLYFFCGFLLSSYSYAAEKLPLASIVAQAERYLQAQVAQTLPQTDQNNIQITSSALDHRLSLSHCDKPLTFSHRQSANLQGRVSIKVSCHSNQPWAVYTRHYTSLYKAVVTTNKPLPRNHILQASDFTTINKDIFKQRPGFINNINQLIGKRLKRPIKSGSMLYGYHLSQPAMIKKGHNVNVIAKIGGLSVITSGIALSSGKYGEQIKVENTRSSRIITAEITGPDTVEVVL